MVTRHVQILSLSRRPRARHESVSRAKTLNRRSCLIRTASASSERSKEGQGESFEHSSRRMEEGIQRYNTNRNSCPHDKQKKQYPEEEVKRRVYSRTRKKHVPPVLGNDNTSDLVVIKAKISRRQVNRVYMDSGSSCEVIYEQCFLQLKPSIKSLRVDSKVPLIGFS
ncbi:hypothetical protein Tco_0559932 [Tanacetum coccineum]